MLSNLLRNMTDGVKNLLMINILMFVAIYFFPQFERMLMLYYFESEYFKPFQVITHLFMHADFMHLLFNMVLLVFLGSFLERHLGLKKFLIVYFLSGVGASILPMIVHYFEYSNLMSTIELYKETRANEVFYSFLNENFYPISDYYTLEFNEVVNDVVLKMQKGVPYADSEVILLRIYENTINTPSLGASGCMMGILAAFGFLFPNQELHLLLPPISVPAKLYVPAVIYFELIMGIANFRMDNIGHWAHVGGAIVGLIMVYIWNKRSSY